MSGQVTDAEAIREAVKAYYGRAAGTETSCCSSAASSCCGETEQRGPYAADELAQVPADAATHSHGCGNPVALASLRPGEVVLDLGSGGGLDVLLAAQRVGPQGFVYGLDMTDEMLDLARRNALKAGAMNVDFLKGDLESIPLSDASVDVIISNCVVNLAPDKARALAEAHRVLKPGGRLAISDIVVDGRLDDLPLSEAPIRGALSWAGCIAGALTVEQYRQFLAEAGFEQIDVEIHHRYSPDDLIGDMRDGLSHLAPRVLRDLVGRFASSYITALRPKRA